MKPYYSDDAVTIYHGDCRDVAPHIAPTSVDLLLTDPPYGMAFQSGWTAAKLTVKSDGVRQGIRVVRSALNALRPTFASDMHAGPRQAVEWVTRSSSSPPCRAGGRSEASAPAPS